MAKRHSMSRHGSRKSFSHHASKTHKFNMPKSLPMRGGIRM